MCKASPLEYDRDGCGIGSCTFVRLGWLNTLVHISTSGSDTSLFVAKSKDAISLCQTRMVV